MSVSRRHPSLSRIRPAAVAAALLALIVAGLAAPPADAVSSSSITVSGDGYTAGLSSTASAFGSTYGPNFHFGQGTVTEMYPVTPAGGAFVNFLAR